MLIIYHLNIKFFKLINLCSYVVLRSYLEKNVHSLIEGADELCQDAQKLHNYQRNVARQQQQIDNYKQRRVSFSMF